jgi:hypothetical protein
MLLTTTRLDERLDFSHRPSSLRPTREWRGSGVWRFGIVGDARRRVVPLFRNSSTGAVCRKVGSAAIYLLVISCAIASTTRLPVRTSAESHYFPREPVTSLVGKIYIRARRRARSLYSARAACDAQQSAKHFCRWFGTGEQEPRRPRAREALRGGLQYNRGAEGPSWGSSVDDCLRSVSRSTNGSRPS